MQTVRCTGRCVCRPQNQVNSAPRRISSPVSCNSSATRDSAGSKPKATRSAYAAEPAEVFQHSGCVGCHAGGGNIVQAGVSLQTNDLQKNGAATTDAIYKLVYYGKGKMPGYGKECTPRGKCTFGPRMADEDIQRLSQYVLDQAAVKWK